MGLTWDPFRRCSSPACELGRKRGGEETSSDRPEEGAQCSRGCLVQPPPPAPDPSPRRGQQESRGVLRGWGWGTKELGAAGSLPTGTQGPELRMVAPEQARNPPSPAAVETRLYRLLISASPSQGGTVACVLCSCSVSFAHTLITLDDSYYMCVFSSPGGGLIVGGNRTSLPGHQHLAQ